MRIDGNIVVYTEYYRIYGNCRLYGSILLAVYTVFFALTIVYGKFTVRVDG